MLHPTDEPIDSGTPSPETLHDAFRQLHGARLHGFALLLCLGERAVAARLAAEALRSAQKEASDLRHPERAAAWLRARVVRRLPRRRESAPLAERQLALSELGVEPAVLAGLSGLDRHERAAIVASAIEQLDRRDVETVVGRQGAALDRLLARARRRYVLGSAAAADREDASPGPLVSRVRELAARSMQ